MTGGSCVGKFLISSGGDCSGSFRYPSETCTEFDLGSGNVRPAHVGAQYTVTRGTCSVTSPATAKGTAAPSGAATVVCCQAAE